MGAALALRSTSILVAYAIEFSLPLAAIMLGVSFGTSVAEATIRVVTGVLLITAGFYFLGTL